MESIAIAIQRSSFLSQVGILVGLPMIGAFVAEGWEVEGAVGGLLAAVALLYWANGEEDTEWGAGEGSGNDI
ncbi:MAG: hypothetical protein AAB955_00880 [Patescibacteria group bacterium]